MFYAKCSPVKWTWVRNSISEQGSIFDLLPSVPSTDTKLSGVARGRCVSSGSKGGMFEGWNGPSPVGTIRSFQCSRAHQLYCSSLYLWLIISLTLGRVMAVPLSAPHSLLSAPHMGLASAKHTSRSELSPLYFVACIRPYVFPPHHKHALGWEGG